MTTATNDDYEHLIEGMMRRHRERLEGIGTTGPHDYRIAIGNGIEETTIAVLHDPDRTVDEDPYDLGTEWLRTLMDAKPDDDPEPRTAYANRTVLEQLREARDRLDGFIGQLEDDEDR